MIRYDPDWLADGRLDQRKYPIYLIATFWAAVVISLIGMVGLAISVLVASRVFTAALFLVLAAGLILMGLVREKAKTASVR
jgi:hypothetical protein